jgi:hypothetical protein
MLDFTIRFLVILLFLTINSLVCQEHSSSIAENGNFHGNQEEDIMSEKEALTRAAHNYITVLDKIGTSRKDFLSKEILPLCAKNCRKVRNGRLLFAGRDSFAAQLDSGKEWLGMWSIEVCELLIATDERAATIQYKLSTEKEGDLIVIVILYFDSNFLIKEINEVHNFLEK